MRVGFVDFVAQRQLFLFYFKGGRSVSGILAALNLSGHISQSLLLTVYTVLICPQSSHCLHTLEAAASLHGRP